MTAKTAKAQPVYFTIPANVLQFAKKETKTPEGDKYDESLGGVMQAGLGNQMSACLNGEGNRGVYQMVLVIGKDGNLRQIFAEKHNAVYDCLVPKFRAVTYPRPPYAPFYYLFELRVTK